MEKGKIVIIKDIAIKVATDVGVIIHIFPFFCIHLDLLLLFLMDQFNESN